MFTKKVKYTLKLLLALAAEREGSGRLLRIEDFALRSGVPRNYVYELILDIRAAGIVSSKRGQAGGYMLVKDPADIFVSQVLRLLGEPIVPLPCLSLESRAHCLDCSEEPPCRARESLLTLLEGHIRHVDSLTLRDLIGP